MREGMSGRELFVVMVATVVAADFAILIINYSFYRKSDTTFLIKVYSQAQVAIFLEEERIALLEGIRGDFFSQFQRKVSHFNFPPRMARVDMVNNFNVHSFKWL
jgi:hypothetical protein